MSRIKGDRLDSTYVVLSTASDIVAIALSLLLAMQIRFGAFGFNHMSALLGTFAFYCLCSLLLSDMETVHRARTCLNRSLLAYRMIRIALFTTVLYVIMIFLFKLPPAFFINSRLVVVMLFSFWCTLSILFRLALPWLVIALRDSGVLRLEKVRILACGEETTLERVRKLLTKSVMYRKTLEFVTGPSDAPCSLGDLEGYIRRMGEEGCDDLCIAAENVDYDTVARFVTSCQRLGISLSFYSPLFENLGYYDSWISFPDMPAVVFFNPPMSAAGDRLWRLVDTVIASMLLVALLPLFAVVALLVKLSSPGPVFFRQKRIGLGETPFVFFKFRSMTNDSSSNTSAHREYFRKYAEGIRAEDGREDGFKLKDNARITSVGRIIRKASVDELPQLWNVVRGDMSLVGPRPCISYELEHYRDWQRIRFTVKPGLTGIWQVYGRSRLPFDAAQFLDLCYAFKRNISLNIRLLLKTIPVVFFGRGGV